MGDEAILCRTEEIIEHLAIGITSYDRHSRGEGVSFVKVYNDLDLRLMFGIGFASCLIDHMEELLEFVFDVGFGLLLVRSRFGGLLGVSIISCLRLERPYVKWSDSPKGHCGLQWL